MEQSTAANTEQSNIEQPASIEQPAPARQPRKRGPGPKAHRGAQLRTTPVTPAAPAMNAKRHSTRRSYMESRIRMPAAVLAPGCSSLHQFARPDMPWHGPDAQALANQGLTICDRPFFSARRKINRLATGARRAQRKPALPTAFRLQPTACSLVPCGRWPVTGPSGNLNPKPGPRIPNPASRPIISNVGFLFLADNDRRIAHIAPRGE